MFSKLKRIKKSLLFGGSSNYWEGRYKDGGNSGAGSYGEYADFKGKQLNRIISLYQVDSIIEFGCGDGNQLRYFNAPKYLGIDVSGTAVEKCIRTYKDDVNKSFAKYDPRLFYNTGLIIRADMTISLEVVFHLIEDRVFEKYMSDIFDTANKVVVIFSTNTNEQPKINEPHYKNRKFTDWVKNNRPSWKLTETIPSIHPELVKSCFFIYSRV